jgi:hypothetical protein
VIQCFLHLVDQDRAQVARLQAGQLPRRWLQTRPRTSSMRDVRQRPCKRNSAITSPSARPRWAASGRGSRRQMRRPE